MLERNRQIRMKRHPQGMVTVDDFVLVESDLPELQPDQILVRNEFLSLDPYMRLRMDPMRSYVEPLQIGDLMPGGTVGQVVASRDDAVPVLSRVTGMLGWQSHAVTSKGEVRVIDPRLPRPTAVLGVLGMTGVTAHYGMQVLGQPRPGETVVVTAAAGAVGSIAGQIAKIDGCHVVGIAGGAEKCRHVVNDLTFDACIDYRAPDFEQRLLEATPNHVDVLFENVGGAVMEAVLQRINDHARIALCGNISDYNAREPYPFRSMRQLLVHRVKMLPFIISDQTGHWRTALRELQQWIQEGRLHDRETVTTGLHNAPDAFIRLLGGGSLGKQLVRL